MSVARAIRSAKVLAGATLIVADAAFGAGGSRAAEGLSLPPAAYKPLPIGTKIEYDNAAFTVARTGGYTTVFKKQTGGSTTWAQTYAVFGEYGADVYARNVRSTPLEYDLDSNNKKKLEALWPLVVGKATTYQLNEAAGFYSSPTQSWTIALKVAGTEIVELGGTRYQTYVVEERGVS